MAIKTAHDLFVSELRDIHSVEKQAARAYPKLAKAARSEELKQALGDVSQGIETQLARLHRVFDILDKKSSGETCRAMKGLVEEAHEALDRISKGPLLDAALVAASQRIEHYKIASYGTAAALAEALREEEIHSLLAATLDDAKTADEKLSGIAESINAQLLPEPQQEIEAAPRKQVRPAVKSSTQKKTSKLK